MSTALLHVLDINHIQTACVLLLMLSAIFFDIRERRIPNRLIASALVVALPIQMLSQSIWAWATGILIGFALFLPGYLFKQMGAGDVKLMATVGSFFGASGAFKIGITAYIIGGGYALVWMALQRDSHAWWQYLKLRLRIGWMLMATMSGNPLSDQGLSNARPRTAAMPYSVPIAMAALYAVFVGW